MRILLGRCRKWEGGEGDIDGFLGKGGEELL